MKVVAFNGSPRREGNTAFLLNRVLCQLSGEGIETELIQLGGARIHGCGACYKCMGNKDGHCSVTDDQANEFVDKIVAADGLLIGSPTYFADITTETKAFIDRAGFVARANGGLFRRKVGAAVVVNRRAGGIHAFDSINHLFLISEMIVPGSSYWNVCLALKPGEAANDAEAVATMDTLGKNMAWVMKKLYATG
jgi:multimeric flavodoxin WrbA